MVSFWCGLSRPAVSAAVDAGAVRSVQAGRSVTLFVPEQFSFETEKRIAATLPLSVREKLNITSFSRFCQHMIERYWPDRADYLDENGRLVLMVLTVRDLCDKLQLYGGAAGDPKLAAALLQVRDEIKNAGITPEQLAKCAAAHRSAMLGLKLQDVSLCLEAFDKRLEGSYFDHIDDASRTAMLLEKHPVFAGQDVYFDAFSDFTAVQLQLITRIMAGSENTVFGLLYDTAERGDEAFTPQRETLRRLRRAAKEQELPVRHPIQLEEPDSGSETDFFKRNFLRADCDSRPGPPEHIRLYRAAGRDDEALTAAMQIRRLCTERGYRFREVGVIVRSLEGWRVPLESAFRDYGIPAFFDGPRQTGSGAVAAFLVCAAQLAAGGLRTDRLLQLGKTGFTDVDPLVLADLENYAFVWNIEGGAWAKPFTASPRGLSAPAGEEDAARLAALEQARKTLVQPVLRLRGVMKEQDGAAVVRALYQLTEDMHLAQGLKRHCAMPAVAADRETVRGLSQQYAGAMQLLGQLELTLRDVRLPAAQFVRLLEGTLAGLEYGQIPRAADEVEVGCADLYRDAGRRALFVLGLNEGEFPAVRQEKGLFSASDRRLLGREGFPFLDESERAFPEELSYAFRSMSAFTDELYLSYSAADALGAQKYESVLVSKVLELFPDLPLKDSTSLSPADRALTPRTAARLAGELPDGPVRAAFLQVLGEREDTAPLRDLFMPRRPEQFSLSEKRAGRLFGKEIRLSASKLDTYYNCPFAYFCKYGLRIAPLKKAELSPVETGSVVHYCLEKLLGDIGVQGLEAMPEGQLRPLMQQLLREYLESALGLSEPPDARFAALLHRAEDLLCRIGLHLKREFAQSGFTPADCELPIGPGQQVQSLDLRLPDGTKLLVEGKVDRVDVLDTPQGRFVRVVDYKTGAKSFSLDDVYCGINIQMLLYLFSIWERGEGRYGPVIPAGVLYMPVKDPLVTGETKQQREEQRDRALRMNGLLLEDETALRGMEQDAAGVFIPVKQTKNGLSGGDSLASLEQLGKLKRHVERLVREMGQGLRQGQAGARPLRFADHSACDYCDYRSVCAAERPQERRVHKWKDKDAFYAAISGEDEDER